MPKATTTVDVEQAKACASRTAGTISRRQRYASLQSVLRCVDGQRLAVGDEESRRTELGTERSADTGVRSAGHATQTVARQRQRNVLPVNGASEHDCVTRSPARMHQGAALRRTHRAARLPAKRRQRW